MATVLTPAQLGERFAGLADHSTYRLELLDQYIAESEREPFARFRAGETPGSTWHRPWRDFVAESHRAGKRMERVHVVSEPPTDYVRFEMSCAYPASVEAGEDVRILPRDTVRELNLPDHDYWLFDSKLVGVMDYGDDGRLLRVTLTDDPATVVRHCYWRDVALHHSTPLESYRNARMDHPKPLDEQDGGLQNGSVQADDLA